MMLVSRRRLNADSRIVFATSRMAAMTKDDRDDDDRVPGAVEQLVAVGQDRLDIHDVVHPLASLHSPGHDRVVGLGIAQLDLEGVRDLVLGDPGWRTSGPARSPA